MGEKKYSELWDIKDLSEYLMIPRSSVYVLIAQQKIPSIKIGKHRRFFPEDVKQALKKLRK